jgi:hypothetical protein
MSHLYCRLQAMQEFIAPAMWKHTRLLVSQIAGAQKFRKKSRGESIPTTPILFGVRGVSYRHLIDQGRVCDRVSIGLGLTL